MLIRYNPIFVVPEDVWELSPTQINEEVIVVPTLVGIPGNVPIFDNNFKLIDSGISINDLKKVENNIFSGYFA